MQSRLNNVKWYLIGSALGVLVGAVSYFVQPVKWKAEALIRIGQISLGGGGEIVEPVATVVERFKTRSFTQAVAERVGRNEIEALLNIDEGAGMTVRPIRNSDSIDIVVVGSSGELVRAAIDGAIAEIISRHDASFAAYLAEANKELARLDLEAEMLSKRMANANEKLLKENAVLAAIMTMQTLHALNLNSTRASGFRDAISSMNNRRTALLEGPFVSERRILSSVWRAGLLGALSGLCVSAIWIRWKK